MWARTSAIGHSLPKRLRAVSRSSCWSSVSVKSIRGGPRSSGAQDHGAGRRKPAAGAVDATDLGARYLAAAGLAPQLARGLDEQEHAAHARVTRRQPATIGVGRQRAADPQLAVLDERPAVTLLAEAEALDREEHHRGERVGALEEVDLGGSDTDAVEAETTGL